MLHRRNKHGSGSGAASACFCISFVHACVYAYDFSSAYYRDSRYLVFKSPIEMAEQFISKILFFLRAGVQQGPILLQICEFLEQKCV